MVTLDYRDYVITKPQLSCLITCFRFGGLVTIDFGTGVLYIRRKAIALTNYKS